QVSLDHSAYSASFDTKTVGANKPVTVGGVSLGGADAGDYSVSQPAGLTASITAKGLTITGAVANQKQYDGSTAASIDWTNAGLSGAATGDDVSVDPSQYSASFADKNVGTGKAVTVTGVALGGHDAGNYT